MVLFNYATKELTAKVVYYGPGLCGKTTNLQYIYDTLPSQAKGKMLSLATKTDRTLFFDFLPIDLGTIRGMKTKIQLYTVPGQVFYDTTRKLVLKGADGVVFVADSQKAMGDANLDSFENLITNLAEQNIQLDAMPHVIQFNKRDMKNIMDTSEMDAQLNRFKVPTFEAVAPNGDGVFETLKGISKLVLKSLGQKYGLEEEQPSGETAPEPKDPGLPPKPSKTGILTNKPIPDLPEPGAAAKVASPQAKPEPGPTLPDPEPEEEIELIDDDIIDDDFDDLSGSDLDDPLELDDEPAATKPKTAAPNAPRGGDGHLKPISTIDDSEVIELDDVDPLELEELDDMAEIASMASGGSAPEPVQDTPRVEPITVPVGINLPSSLEGKPIRLQIDITFED